MGSLDGEVRGAAPPTVPQLLQAGIAAAKAGARDRARDLLTRVTGLDADNITAWLWLSSVVDGPLEQEACLERVLEIDPGHSAALKGLAVVRQRAIDALFAAANAAADAGDDAGVRDALMQIVERDEANLDAWLWLSRAVETPEDQEICYENVLALAPDNVEAAEELAAVAEKLATIRQLREAASTNIYDAVPVDAPPVPQARDAPTLAAAVLGDAYREKHTEAPAEPEPSSVAASGVAASGVAAQMWAKYEDELACPYCTAPTAYGDRRCPSCNNRLWIKTRRRDEPSMLFWIVFAFQAFSTVMVAAGPFLALYFVSTRVGLDDFTRLFGVYLGAPGSVPPEMAAQALQMFPRIFFFLAWFPVLISTAYTIALWLRWPPIFYLMLGNAGIGLVSSIVGLGIYATQGLFAIVAGVIGLLISIGTFALVLQLEDDFRRDKWRIRLKVDGDIKDGMAFLIRGRQYADQKMWARAAVHFRRAAALLAYQTDGHVAAAMACIRLKDFDLAEYILGNAQNIDPESQQIAGLLALIEEQRATVPTEESAG